MFKWILVILFLSGVVQAAELPFNDILNRVFDNTDCTLRVIVDTGSVADVGYYSSQEIFTYVYDETNNALRIQIIP